MGEAVVEIGQFDWNGDLDAGPRYGMSRWYGVSELKGTYSSRYQRRLDEYRGGRAREMGGFA
jgi:hypothetical protein